MSFLRPNGFMVLALISLQLGFAAFAITEKQVVASSLKHYPEVKEAVLNLDFARAQHRMARGAFDAKIKGKADSRTKGYYDGDYIGGQIEKPLAYLNSKVYTGMRKSDGIFPSYEGKMETLSDGEMFAGVSLSLLRDSFIDERRYRARLNKEEEKQFELLLTRRKIAVQTMALKAYWYWVAVGHQRKTRMDLLELAKLRDGKLRRRIKAGDLARIYATENRQYIIKREAALIEINNDFRQACFYLSLFYRDEEGKPIVLSEKDVPEVVRVATVKLGEFRKLYPRAEGNNLDLKILDSKTKQAEATVSMGTNEFLPRVDLNFEWNRDNGSGPDRLRGAENRIMLNLEIPIEFRKAQGKRRMGVAKRDGLKVKREFQKDKLKVGLRRLLLDTKASAEVFRLTGEQIGLSKKLVDAENRKFVSGASDLILLNLREQNYADAQIKHMEALYKYKKHLAELKEMLLEFI